LEVFMPKTGNKAGAPISRSSARCYRRCSGPLTRCNASSATMSGRERCGHAMIASSRNGRCLAMDRASLSRQNQFVTPSHLQAFESPGSSEVIPATFFDDLAVPDEEALGE